MEALEELLPQAEPMVLLSGYDPDAPAGSVSAYVDVSERSPFFEVEADGVDSCVALEYMAQAMALVVGLSRRAKGLPPQIGFVLGSRKFETFVSHFRRGLRYGVKATCTYEDESFGSFDCEVCCPDGSCAARATMTAFPPGGEMTPEKLREYE